MNLADISHYTARRAREALGGNSAITFARDFTRQPASGLGQIADHYGFAQAGQALRSGRIDQLVAAAGADAIGALVDAGARLVNRRLDAALGKWGELLKAFDRSDPPPAGEVMLVLGDLPFMVGTLAHQSLSRSCEYRWAAQERLLRAPSRQFIGAGNDSISLQGYALPHYTGGDASLLRLRQLADSGEPHLLLDHFGRVYGRYVVERIQQTGSELDLHGLPRRLEFSIELAAYGEDEADPVFARGRVTVGEIEQVPDDEVLA